MEQAARAAGIVDNIVDPELSPTRDFDPGRHPYAHRTGNASRASVPLSHRRSISTVGGGGRSRSRANSTRSRASNYPDYITQQHHRHADIPAASAIGTAITTEDPHDDTGEIPWGPDHPCFPHPNPHVPLASPLYLATRIIRVKRDWMQAGDLAPTFTTLYPEILDWFPCLSEAAFKELVSSLNTLLVAAFSPWAARAWLDTLLGVATGWLWDDAGAGAVRRAVRGADAFLERWNREHGVKDGVRVISLKRTGFLSLDIQIPDPHIVGAEENEEDLDRHDAGTETEAESQSRATSGGRKGSRGSSLSGHPRRAPAREDGGVQPVVPPIPTEFLQEGAALAITMEGFRSSVDD